MDLELRNSDKANLDLALLEVDRECWYSADNHADQQVSTLDRVSRMQAAQRDLQRHELSLTHMSALLQVAKSEIARFGSLSEKIQNMVRRIFSLTDGLFTQFCLNAGPTEARMEDRPLEKVVDHQTDEKYFADGVVAMIDDYLEEIGTLKEYAARRENLERDAEARSFSLPPADVTDKLLRYESHLERQLYRAMDQLERLQRRRRGENVPPPLTVNLGRRR